MAKTEKRKVERKQQPVEKEETKPQAVKKKGERQQQPMETIQQQQSSSRGLQAQPISHTQSAHVSPAHKEVRPTSDLTTGQQQQQQQQQLQQQQLRKKRRKF